MLLRARSFFLLAALARASPLETRDGLRARDMPRPRFGKVPYGVDITQCTVQGKVALTFDDGPSEFTSRILDTLDANDVKATFFVVGANGDTEGLAGGLYVGDVKRMVAEGHQVGSHSWSHQDLEQISPDARASEILKNEDIFVKTLGFFPTYFRPPYTDCAGGCLGALGQYAYHVVCFCAPFFRRVDLPA